MSYKHTKDMLGIMSFAVTFTLGWGLTIAGFCVEPVGEVSNSVLWILGQALLYCGAILGISSYCKEQIANIRDEIRKR